MKWGVHFGPQPMTRERFLEQRIDSLVAELAKRPPDVFCGHQGMVSAEIYGDMVSAYNMALIQRDEWQRMYRDAEAHVGVLVAERDEAVTERNKYASVLQSIRDQADDAVGPF